MKSLKTFLLIIYYFFYSILLCPLFKRKNIRRKFIRNVEFLEFLIGRNKKALFSNKATTHYYLTREINFLIRRTTLKEIDIIKKKYLLLLAKEKQEHRERLQRLLFLINHWGYGQKAAK